MLRLTAPGELPDCTHFLAVSYTWQQPVDAPSCYEAEVPGYTIATSDGAVRLARAPVNVLDRVIGYAAMQGLRCMWIDQECID